MSKIERAKKEIGLAMELGSSALQQRFETLFSVAARKSLQGWRHVSVMQAQVLVVDGEQPGDEAAVWTPCVVYVGGQPQALHLGSSPQRWATRLDADFTLADLIDMLDRAGVFIMQWSQRQQIAAQQSLTRALADLEGKGLDCSYHFHLKAWVALPAPWNQVQGLRALAVLSRKAVDVRSLCTHSGLEVAELAQLLAHPGLRSALVCSWRPADAMKAAGRAPAARFSGQWVRRLAGWVARGGRT
ncbi:hypothetical protein [Comamonas composti]|uniref:hypothetical protein n=1 Tax=Comamonas composti TaxID=408558 RepID=UPI000404F1D5|nr:hypothetical protein [Comamonas composti]